MLWRRVGGGLAYRCDKAVNNNSTCRVRFLSRPEGYTANAGLVGKRGIW